MLSSEASDRGKESPMDLDSPPLIWFNSQVPPSSLNGTPTSRAACSSERSSPYPMHRPVASAGKAIPRTRHLAGLWSMNSNHNNKMRSSPLTRRLRAEGINSSSSDSGSSTKKKRGEPEKVEKVQNRMTNPQHLYLPVIIMGYLQVAFNVVMISAVLYCLAQFFLTIQRDVQIKVNEELSTIMTEISQCAKQYIENRCSPELRVPAMEKPCIAWENCMKRDPSVVGRAKLSAETFAEIINSFIEPISYKTMIFILTALFGTIFLSNYAFSIARNRVSAGYVNNFGPNPVAFRDPSSTFPGLSIPGSTFSTPGGKTGSLLALQ